VGRSRDETCGFTLLDKNKLWAISSSPVVPVRHDQVQNQDYSREARDR
jgi:hypothetical protein